MVVKAPSAIPGCWGTVFTDQRPVSVDAFTDTGRWWVQSPATRNGSGGTAPPLGWFLCLKHHGSHSNGGYSPRAIPGFWGWVPTHQRPVSLDASTDTSLVGRYSPQRPGIAQGGCIHHWAGICTQNIKPCQPDGGYSPLAIMPVIPMAGTVPLAIPGRWGTVPTHQRPVSVDASTDTSLVGRYGPPVTRNSSGGLYPMVVLNRQNSQTWV
ncbi:hypothetical protein PCASD_26246 [Puccinia coronata f. sp. avenae]|uniref:Uncharacterized protein n=1 Tax=Puccinia coronata f. sp. avenae TaxID=200324 RepID=A0A2N5RZ96_9BASI|nr:hypothetical protein PCASD_26246 [Puccinia coronata f. sp. avenae]